MKFHFCGHSYNLYAGIQMPDGDNQNLDCELSPAENKCCDGSKENCCNKDSECENCTDLIKEVETDIDYIYTYQYLLDEIAEQELFFTKNLENIEYKILSSSFNYTEYYSPPDSKISSVWLC